MVFHWKPTSVICSLWYKCGIFKGGNRNALWWCCSWTTSNSNHSVTPKNYLFIRKQEVKNLGNESFSNFNNCRFISHTNTRFFYWNAGCNCLSMLYWCLSLWPSNTHCFDISLWKATDRSCVLWSGLEDFEQQGLNRKGVAASFYVKGTLEPFFEMWNTKLYLMTPPSSGENSRHTEFIVVRNNF